MEERLDQVTRQNEELSREVRELRAVSRDQSREFPEPGDATQLGANPSGGTSSGSSPTAGGGSKTSGGDPTATGRAQEVGNPHLGKLAIKSYYDFDNDGFGWSTRDDEYTLDVRALT
jgi:phosphate-selective porin OprO/OprP